MFFSCNTFQLSFYHVLVIFSLINFIFCVSQLQEGDNCHISRNLRGICTSLHRCKSVQHLKRDSEHLVRCNPQDRSALLVCCEDESRNERLPQKQRSSRKQKFNAFFSTESSSIDETFDEIETIFDVKKALQDPIYSEGSRSKHSIPFQRKSDLYRPISYEPNQVQPPYQEKLDTHPSFAGMATSPEKQASDHYLYQKYTTEYQRKLPQNTYSNGYKSNNFEENRDGPQRYSTQPVYYESPGKSPSGQTSSLPPGRYSSPSYQQPDYRPIYNEQPQRPPPYSGPSEPSPWQHLVQPPLIEDPSGYPIYSATTARPDKRISEIKCKEYSEIVTETIAGLPLVTDPKPVEINVQKCNYNAHQLIVGGQNTSLGEFPHMAAVGFLDRKKRTISWNCGGSLISEHFVLTAAHCTTSNQGAPSVVRLGEHNLKRGDDGAHPVDYLVKQVVRHPDYRPPIRYHDIALLRLSRPVAFTTHIRPACLYSKLTFATSKTVATGWGRIQYAEEQSDVLLKVVLNIIDNERCNGLYKSEGKTELLSRGIIDQQMCAGELTGGKDTCQGDSGGPIEVTSRSNQCVHHIIGVTSFGKRCGQPNAPGVYTRVASYLSWIEGVVWPDLVRVQHRNNFTQQSSVTTRRYDRTLVNT